MSLLLRTLTLVTVLTAGAALSPAMADESDWAIDHGASTLSFTFESYGGEHEGVFTRWSAVIRSGPEDLANAFAEVTVDLGSIDTNNDDRDDTAKGSIYLDAGSHPEAVFKTSAFRGTGNGTYEADAALTIKGETREITLPFTLEEKDGGTVRVTGTATFNRESFGIGEEGEYEEAGKTIAVHVDLTATRK